MQGPGTSSAGRAQRSYFSLVRAVLLGTANVRISSCKSPVWIVFWDDLWTLLDNAVGIEAQFLVSIVTLWPFSFEFKFFLAMW